MNFNRKCIKLFIFICIIEINIILGLKFKFEYFKVDFIKERYLIDYIIKFINIWYHFYE